MIRSILLMLIFINSTEQWLSITQIKDISFKREDLCNAKYGFNYRQIRFCEKNIHLMPFIYFGTHLALKECQNQFQNRHWNCTLFVNNHSIGNILDSGTKESAYIHALTSAGIAYAITKACSTGRLRSCGCDLSMRETNMNGSIRWGGCSDNVLFGTEIARRFVNLREKKVINRIGLLNLHNNHLGIRIILLSVDRQCKCHGISGSCEFKSCWRSLYSFTQIANQLKEYYDNSIEVHLQQHANNDQFRFLPKKIPFQNSNHFSSRILRNNLIFSQSSPNFCEINLSRGSFGTKGRLCDRTSRAIHGCDLLCCNRGYQSEILTRHTQCNCRFQWCCQVQCQNCVTTEEISRCL